MKNRLTVSSCLTSLFAVAILACSAEATPPRDEQGGSGGGGNVPGAGNAPGNGGFTFGGTPGGGGVPGSGNQPAGGSFGFSGTPGTGNSPGVGGTPGGAGAATCPTTPVTAGKVDDLEDGDNGILPPLQGYWYSYNDKSGGTQMPPQDVSGANPWPPAPGGSTTSPAFAACTSGSGFSVWGAGIGFNVTDLGPGRSCARDLSTATGIKFNIKGTSSGMVRMQIATSGSADPPNGGTCMLGPMCNYHPNYNITLTPDWSSVTVLWGNMMPGVVPFSPSGVIGIQFQAVAPPAVTFNFCVDDIEIL